MAALWAGPAHGCFMETEEVSLHLHKRFHWLNGEGSYAHIRISSFSLSRIAGFQGEQADEEIPCVCVCVYVCMCVQGRGGMVCHDSSAWIKCGTLIWVKIMESYMSLSMSVFHRVAKWKVTAGRAWGGRQRCLKWEPGDREAIPVVDLQSDRGRTHCHPTSSS